VNFAGRLKGFLAKEGKWDYVTDYAQGAAISGPMEGRTERSESAETAGRATNTERMLYVPFAF